MHVVLPWSWPSHGSYLSQGLPAVVWILHESGYPLLVLELMALKPPFSSLYYCPELSRPEASLRRLSLAMPYPCDAFAWRCFNLVTPFLGDALARQSLLLATPQPGDASVGQSVDFLPWVPRGVLPHLDFDLWSMPGDGTVHFLDRFVAQVVKLHTKDEDMMMHAFRKGVLLGPFTGSLIRCRPKMFCEIKRRVVAQIVAKGAVTEKRALALSDLGESVVLSL